MQFQRAVQGAVYSRGAHYGIAVALALVMTKSTRSIIIAECMALSCRGPGLGCRPLPRVTDRLFYAVHGAVTSSRRAYVMPTITGG